MRFGSSEGKMSDEELLDLIERVRDNLIPLSNAALNHRDPWEEHVLEFNRELQRLIAADINVSEWLIPESLIKPSYGRRTLPSGEEVRLKRVDSEEFYRRANPAVQFLNREIAKRRRALAGDSSMATKPTGDLSEVWVIYGHDEPFRKTIFDLLRTVGLKPIEFESAVKRSGSGSPFVLDVVLNEIGNAPAIVSLSTPDDHAELREEMRDDPKDAEEHRDAGYQPRPNVILETGMALAALRNRTILVTKGRLREISDMGGMHEVRWDGSLKKRNDLVNRLEAMSCPVDRSGTDWLGKS
jgi:predicted nucleotide-binding protein